MRNSNSSTQVEIEFDAAAFFLACALVLVAAWSVAAGGWTESLWVLQFAALAAALAGGVLAYSQFDSNTSALIAACYGVGGVGFLLGLTLPRSLSWHDRSITLLARLLRFVSEVATGGASKDTLMFVLVNALIFWILGSACVWHVLRNRNAWAGILPGGLVLLLNLVYYNGPVPMQRFLALYLALSLLLLARTTLRSREAAWREGRVGYSSAIRFEIWRSALLAALLILLIAWFAPGAAASPRMAAAWQAAASPWQSVRATWQRMFAAVYGAAPAGGDYYGRALSLGGGVNLTDRPIMDVRVVPGPRYYWRARAYDDYSDGRWTSTTQLQIRLPANDRGLARPQQAARRPVTATFYMHSPGTAMLYGVSQPYAFSQDVTLEASVNDLNEFDVWSARANRLVPQGDAYTVLSTISIANEIQLRAAGSAYPPDVRERFLSLPDTITARTRALADQLVAGQPTQYDAAVAVQDYLRQTIAYSLHIPPPPAGQDPVDWVLFTQREGYCNYYASAMVILLRSAGIPARLSVGFAQGAYDLDTGLYRVVESDAHAWPEVFFPGYGWVEFEPTAAQPVIDRTVTVAGAGAPEDLAPEPPGAAEDPRQREQGDLSGAAGGALGRQGASGWLLWGGLALVGVLGAGSAVWLRRRRALASLSPAALAYSHLEGAARWVGVRAYPAWTPRERAQALASRLPDGQSEIDEITSEYEAETYGGEEAGGPAAAQAWRKLRPAVWRGALRRLQQRLARSKTEPPA